MIGYSHVYETRKMDFKQPRVYETQQDPNKFWVLVT